MKTKLLFYFLRNTLILNDHNILYLIQQQLTYTNDNLTKNVTLNPNNVNFLHFALPIFRQTIYFLLCCYLKNVYVRKNTSILRFNSKISITIGNGIFHIVLRIPILHAYFLRPIQQC